jgi:hypothetical protein
MHSFNACMVLLFVCFTTALSGYGIVYNSMGVLRAIGFWYTAHITALVLATVFALLQHVPKK